MKLPDEMTVVTGPDWTATTYRGDLMVCRVMVRDDLKWRAAQATDTLTVSEWGNSARRSVTEQLLVRRAVAFIKEERKKDLGVEWAS